MITAEEWSYHYENNGQGFVARETLEIMFKHIQKDAILHAARIVTGMCLNGSGEINRRLERFANEVIK